ncbi:uncharacterized protein N7469_005876 [Penicillium citrinum]|uniref:Uncharacterized protein n=1 Tax=Penicillium citrinum TaxID=5077 RepID=A0A9W9NWX0_PENCI|nr:uncharacterized protein N7469_005876 [Penicillium citrinum]KAJ5231288.1 hypothetical protein N7469_005876 [Penicillium citrinum]
MNLKMSLYFFVAASGFFLAINFQNFVWAVVYYLKDNEVPTDINKSKGTIQVVLRFFFDSGFFFAITLCYWRFPEPDSDINDIEKAEIDHGIINRTPMQPREAEGSQITAADAAKEKIIHEVSDSNGLLETDNSNGIPDKKHLLEADSGNVILEADSKSLVEKA